MNRVRVLYVGGLGSSGSTVLSRALGGLPGFCHAGELVFLWNRGADENHLCGCGSPFRDCGFWSEVGRRAFGGWDDPALARLAGLRQEVDRARCLPWLLSSRPPRRFAARLRQLTGVLDRLYRAIQESSGCAVVVDSSKHVSYAAVLRRVPSVDLRVLHVTRDSRGVAYSWAKRVRRPEVTGRDASMARVAAPRAAARWTAYNGLFDVLRLRHRHGMRSRYEEFVADPSGTLTRAAALAGRPTGPGDLGFLSDGGLDLDPEHSVSGNPMRFTEGIVPLCVDDAWRSSLGRGDRALVTALTAPAMLRYGYRLRG